MICATLVHIQTDTHTERQHSDTMEAAELKKRSDGSKYTAFDVSLVA